MPGLVSSPRRFRGRTSIEGWRQAGGPDKTAGSTAPAPRRTPRSARLGVKAVPGSGVRLAFPELRSVHDQLQRAGKDTCPQRQVAGCLAIDVDEYLLFVPERPHRNVACAHAAHRGQSEMRAPVDGRE
jgi:hypothetical protein